jgi:drug/metabolite transporter (DMT)-like permease
VSPALWAAALTGVQVGAATVASRGIAADVPPLTLALLRYAVGLVCLAPFIFRSFRPSDHVHRPSSATKIVVVDVLVMAALGIGQFGILIALLNAGLQHIGAAQAALIFSLFPLLTLLLGAALGRERITTALLLGVLLSLAGVALSLAPKLSAPHAGHWWGEAAVLASAAVGALCSVLYRPYLQRYPTLPVSALAMGASVLFLAGAALTEGWPGRVGALNGSQWAVVGFIGLSSAVGYVLWLYALKHESPARVTVFLALNPVTAALLGAGLLGEALTPWTLLALPLIAAGLWLSTRSPAAQQG